MLAAASGVTTTTTTAAGGIFGLTSTAVSCAPGGAVSLGLGGVTAASGTMAGKTWFVCLIASQLIFCELTQKFIYSSKCSNPNCSCVVKLRNVVWPNTAV